MISLIECQCACVRVWLMPLTESSVNVTVSVNAHQMIKWSIINNLIQLKVKAITQTGQSENPTSLTTDLALLVWVVLLVLNQWLTAHVNSIGDTILSHSVTSLSSLTESSASNLNNELWVWTIQQSTESLNDIESVIYWVSQLTSTN